MKWFFPHQSRIKPAWTFEAGGVIWRLMPTHDGFLIGEDRNKDSKSVSFFCLRIDTGEVLWNNLEFGEKWWIGLETVHRALLILHGFAAPDLPGHKKIHAVERTSGKHLWSNEDLQFLLAHGEFVYGAKDTYDEREFYELALSTGEIVRTVSTAEMNAIRGEAIGGMQEIVDFPAPIDLAHIEELLPVAQAVKKAVSSARKVEYLEYVEKNEVYIFGSYESTPTASGQEPRFLQRIVIVAKDGFRTVYEDVPHSETVSIIPDTFFLKEDMVYYIKNKNVLHALRLP